jgi:hypothetical protein
MLVAGIEVSGTDGRTLVDLLLRIGRDGDLALAHRIERGFSRQNPTLELSNSESDHLLGVLDDPATPGLAKLRAALIQERERRER